MFQKIRKRLLLAGLLFLIAALALAYPVYAGGWAVITLDHLPVDVAAGEPYALGFVVRQHGRTPLQMDEIRVEAKQIQTGQTETFIAKPDAQPGHYQVELLFPQPGSWEWGIQSGLYPAVQPMPTLEVAGSSAASTVPATAAPGTFTFPRLPILPLGVGALLTFAAGVMLIVRHRAQTLSRLAGAGLLVLCGLLVLTFVSSANAQSGRNQPVPVTGTEIEMGRQLFLAKGCVVCHVNARAIEKSETFSVDVGPNLSAYRNDPEYLRSFLANPVSTAADFEMPDLDLSSTEIDALVNFINDTQAK